MKFIVSRKKVIVTEDRQICDEARREELTRLDYRNVRSMEDAAKKVWYRDWINDGINHREENGMVVCELKEKTPQWVVEINSLEELLTFQKKYVSLLLTESAPFQETSYELTIL